MTEFSKKVVCNYVDFELIKPTIFNMHIVMSELFSQIELDIDRTYKLVAAANGKVLTGKSPKCRLLEFIKHPDIDLTTHELVVLFQGYGIDFNPKTNLLTDIRTVS